MQTLPFTKDRLPTVFGGVKLDASGALPQQAFTHLHGAISAARVLRGHDNFCWLLSSRVAQMVIEDMEGESLHLELGELYKWFDVGHSVKARSEGWVGTMLGRPVFSDHHPPEAARFITDDLSLALMPPPLDLACSSIQTVFHELKQGQLPLLVNSTGVKLRPVLMQLTGFSEEEVLTRLDSAVGDVLAMSLGGGMRSSEVHIFHQPLVTSPAVKESSAFYILTVAIAAVRPSEGFRQGTVNDQDVPSWLLPATDPTDP